MGVPTAFQEIDLQSLLDPIAGPDRAGESLRYEGTFDRIREARREDDPTLSQGIYKATLKRADWTTVEAVCTQALATKTKDLQIAAWLLEAWIHLYGFPGVAVGLRLLARLCAEFWDDLHPGLDENDLEARIATFDWIDEKLSLKLKQIPLTSDDDVGEDSYSYVDWESACHFENLALKDPGALREALNRIRPTVTAFRAAILSTDRLFYLNLLESLENARDACTSLEQLLETKCGNQAPRLRQFKEVLFAVNQLTVHALRDRGEVADDIAEELTDQISEDESEIWSTGPIRGRADAYRRLSEVAEYLLRTEPHSPTPYLVKRAVEWGNMSLPELLQQIVRNESEMNEIDRLLRLTQKH